MWTTFNEALLASGESIEPKGSVGHHMVEELGSFQVSFLFLLKQQSCQIRGYASGTI